MGEESGVCVPLNGTKTHPLSKHAIEVLERLSRGMIAAYRINPGVRNRLYREDLIRETINNASSFAQIAITDAGRAALQKIKGG